MPRTIRFANAAGAHVAGPSGVCGRDARRSAGGSAARRCVIRAQSPAAHAATARTSSGSTLIRMRGGGSPSTCRTAASANRSEGIRSQASPPNQAVLAGRPAAVEESTAERGARRTAVLRVVRELVEERRLEVARRPGRADQDQAGFGLVPRPVRELPRHADRHVAHASPPRGEGRREPFPGSGRHLPEVARRLVGEPHGGFDRTRGGDDRHRGDGRQHHQGDAGPAHVSNGTRGARGAS